MSNPTITYIALKTSHGTLHITSSTPPTPPSSSKPTIVLIHGNSSSSLIFTPIFNSPLAYTHRLVAYDLPGHGKSEDSPNPDKSYTQSGYAYAALDMLTHLSIKNVIVLGWSLGGHIGIELLDKLSMPDHPAAKFSGVKMLGLMIVGTPPAIGEKEVKAGFKWKDGHMGAAASDILSEEEVEGMADAACGSKFGGVPQPWMKENVLRTHGKARKRMFEAFLKGEGCDQREVVGKKDTGCLLAVVNGAEEQFVDLEYVDGVEYGNLWEGACHRIPGCGHTPFYENFDKFWPFLEQFVSDCEAEKPGVAVVGAGKPPTATQITEN